MKKVKIALSILCAVACMLSVAFVPTAVNTVSAQDVSTELTEIYPENFGINEGLNDGVFYASHKGASLLGTLFSMDFKHVYGEEVWFYYASSKAWYGINFIFNDGKLKLSESGQGDKAILGTAITFDPAVAGVGSFSEVRMQLSLEAVDNEGDGQLNDVKFGVFFNGKLYNNQYIYANNTADRVGNGIYINNAPSGTNPGLFEIYKPDDSKVPFGVTPADFGFEDGNFDNITKTLPMGLADKEFTANVTLTQGQSVTYAGLKVERTASGKITVSDASGNNAFTAVTVDVEDAEFELKITTNAKTDSTVKATVTVNNKIIATADVANYTTASLTVDGTVKSPSKTVSYGAEALNFSALGMETGTVDNASGEKNTINGEKVFTANAVFGENASIDYSLFGSTSRITFSDLGIADGAYAKANAVSKAYNGSLDKSVFMGKVTLASTAPEIYFGGKEAGTGLKIKLSSTTVLKIYNGTTEVASFNKDVIGKSTFYKQSFDLAIGAVVNGNDVVLYVYFNGTLSGTYTVKDFAADFGSYVTLTSTSTGTVTVASKVLDIDFANTPFDAKNEFLKLGLKNEGGKFAVKVADTQIITDKTATEKFAYDISLKPVALDNDGVNDDMAVTVYVDNAAYGNKYYFIKNCITNPSSNGLTVAVNAKNVKVNDRLPEDDLDTSSVYSLAQTDKDGNIRPFLVTACGDYTINRSNDYKVGDTITVPGEYVIVRNVNGKEYVEKVALWKTGYTNNGEEIDILDFVAMHRYYAAETDSVLICKGGDLNSDGKLNANDLTYMKRILLGISEVPETTYERDKWSFEEDVMPISGFYGPTTSSKGDLNTDKVFKLIADAGINHLSYTVQNVINREQNLIYGDKYGIGITTFIDVPEMDNAQYAEFLGRFSYHKSFKGLFVWDEPKASEMSNYAAKSTKANSYSNIFGYTNLFPNGYSSTDQIGSDYQAYLDEYCATYNPKMISWDHYVFRSNSSLRDYSDVYFTNLSTIRNTAQREGIPFWGFLQLGDPNGVNDTNKSNTITHTASQTLWNANTQLAFGAKGIQYFPLVQPYDYAYCNADGKMYYDASGMISANGEKNKYYDYAVNVNRQIKAVDHILMNSDSKAILATERAKTQTGISATSYGSISSVSNTKSGYYNYGVIIGCFDYNGREAYYVVNNDKSNATTVTLTLNKTHNYTTYTADATATASGSTYSATLAAGAAVLVVMD